MMQIVLTSDFGSCFVEEIEEKYEDMFSPESKNLLIITRSTDVDIDLLIKLIDSSENHLILITNNKSSKISSLLKRNDINLYECVSGVVIDDSDITNAMFHFKEILEQQNEPSTKVSAEASEPLFKKSYVDTISKDFIELALYEMGFLFNDIKATLIGATYEGSDYVRLKYGYELSLKDISEHIHDSEVLVLPSMEWHTIDKDKMKTIKKFKLESLDFEFDNIITDDRYEVYKLLTNL